MLEIYFDGVLLDPNNYMDLTQKWVMFDKEFKLGMTPSREFNLTIPKSVFNPNTQEVKIRYMDSDYAYLIIDKYTYDESAIPKVKITLVDKMVKANFYYDASELCPCTTRDILEDICDKMGVVLGNEHFDNEDIDVNFWDSTLTAREYISYISEMAGGFARIEADGKLWIRKFSEANATTIDANLCEQIVIGQPHEVERVVYDNGVVAFKKARPSKNILNLDEFPSDNMIEHTSTGIITKNNWATEVLSNAKVLELLEPNTTYTLKCKAKVLVRATTTSTSHHNELFCLYRPSSGDIPTLWQRWAMINKQLDGEQVSCVTFTTPSVLTNLRLLSYDFHGTDGTGSNRGIGEIEINDIMLVKGSYTADTFPSYEPYGDLSEDTSLETVYLNQLNVYCNSQEEFDVCADNILGFKYYNLDTGKTYILNNTMCGDVLKMNYEGTNYCTIQNTPDLKYMGLWQGKYQFNVESQVQGETQVRGISTQVKAIKIKQDRDENVLSMAVEDIQTQQDVTNPSLLGQINANTSLIEQRSGEIRSEVSSKEGILQGNIDAVQSNLDDNDEELRGLIADNTTLIQQLKDQIISTIKTTGGSNLLHNSVGYSGTDFWTATGTITTSQDDNMSLSGSEFILTGASTLTQQYNTQIGTKYSISCKIKHRAVGTANQIKIELLGQGTSKVVLDTTDVYVDWYEVKLEEPYTATITNPSVKITCSGDDVLEVTDLIIAVGDNNIWSGYPDEVYGKEHKLDKNGLRLSNIAGNNSSKTTSTSIQMLEGEDVVAELSKQVVSSDTAVITNSFTLGNLQMVVLDENNIIEYI